MTPERMAEIRKLAADYSRLEEGFDSALKECVVLIDELAAAIGHAKSAWDANDSRGVAEECERTFLLLAKVNRP